MLSIGSTWFKRGSGKQFEIPTRWGSSGRINLIGTYSLHGTEEQLEVRELSGSCNGEQVIAYLETLALQAVPDQMTVVVLDNAGIHRSKATQAFVETHERLSLVFLPPYAPEWNPIELVWAYVKRNVLGNVCARSVGVLKAKLVTAWQRVRYINLPQHLMDFNLCRDQ